MDLNIFYQITASPVLVFLYFFVKLCMIFVELCGITVAQKSQRILKTHKNRRVDRRGL